MSGLQGRLAKLEANLLCPEHRVRLSCPQCERGEVEQLTDEQRIAKILEILEMARVRKELAEADADTRARLRAGDESLAAERRMSLADLRYIYGVPEAN